MTPAIRRALLLTLAASGRQGNPQRRAESISSDVQMQVAKLQVSIQDNSLMAQQLQARMATWALLLNFFTASAAVSSCLFFLTAAPSG